jgi:hypothetical protein
MKNNNHLTPLEEKTLEKITESLEELQGIISMHVKPLTPKDRRNLFKMGDKTLAFVKKCYEFSQKNPELCPKYFEMKEFEADFKDANSLYTTVNMSAQLHRKLVDLQMCAGSDALQNALIFYNSVKMAAANDIVGAKVVYEELRKRFPATRRRKPAEVNAPPPAEEEAS